MYEGGRPFELPRFDCITKRRFFRPRPLLKSLHHLYYCPHMTARALKRWRIGIVAALTAATVSFHYGILIPSAHGTVIHAIHGRLCYVPIILAAIWFGVRGGFLSALSITLLTLPYPWLRGITDHHTLVAEYTEMVFYFAIGVMTGVLIERQWRERDRSAVLERELARRERLSSLGQMAA